MKLEYQKINEYHNGDRITNFDQAKKELLYISYGSIRPDINGDCIFIPYTTGSDYSGTTVELSNYNEIKKDFSKYVLDVIGGYSTFGLLVSRKELETSEELQELFDGLESCPVYNEDAWCNLELELIDDTWDTWVKYDLTNELKHYNIELDYDILEPIYWDALTNANNNGDAEPIFENNGVPYIRLNELMPYVLELIKERIFKIMGDFTLKQLSDGKYTLDQVKNMYNQGRISEKIYWEYYHLWRFATYRYGHYTSCFCPDCREGKPKDITTKQLLESIKDNTMTNLKSCPLCDNKASQVKWFSSDPQGYGIECTNKLCHMGLYGFENITESIKAWNNRPREQKLKNKIMKLKGQIK